MNTPYLHFFDRFDLLTLFLITLAVMLVFLEVGFHIGRRTPVKVVKAQVSQVRSIMAAGIGLLAFLMAFTFSIAQGNYQERVNAMVEEARYIRSAYLQADAFPPDDRSRARQLLKEYLYDRITLVELGREGQLEAAWGLLNRSVQIQDELWLMTRQDPLLADQAPSASGSISGFRAAVLGMIDAHVLRVEASLVNRIAGVIWVALYLTAALSMLVMGYHAGLVTRRSPVATATLALVFSTVMMLVIDQDRPVMSLFKIDDRVMVDLQTRMQLISEQGQLQGRPPQ